MTTTTQIMARARSLLEGHEYRMAAADGSDHKLLILANDGHIALNILRALLNRDDNAASINQREVERT